MNDWKQQHANESVRALENRLVVDVVEEFIKNMRGCGVDLSDGLPRYGLRKVMSYVAQVARAQALGFDPDLLVMNATEANDQQLALMRAFAAAGKPVMVIVEEAKP